MLTSDSAFFKIVGVQLTMLTRLACSRQQILFSLVYVGGDGKTRTRTVQLFLWKSSWQSRLSEESDQRFRGVCRITVSMKR